MYIEKKRTNHLRPVLITLAILGVALLGYLYYAHHFQKWPFLPTPVVSAPQQNVVNYQEPTKQQQSAGTSTKEQVAESAKNSENSTPAPASIPVSFTAIQPGSTVYIRTLIGTVTTTATCSLEMKGPNGKTYSATAGVQALSSSSTCQGFNIPMTSLAPGTWTITVTVKDGASTGSATTEKAL